MRVSVSKRTARRRAFRRIRKARHASASESWRKERRVAKEATIADRRAVEKAGDTPDLFGDPFGK